MDTRTGGNRSVRVKISTMRADFMFCIDEDIIIPFSFFKNLKRKNSILDRVVCQIHQTPFPKQSFGLNFSLVKIRMFRSPVTER